MIKFILFAISHILSVTLENLISFFAERADGKQLKKISAGKARPYKSLLYAGLTFCIIAAFLGSPVIFAKESSERLEGLICFLTVIPLGLIPTVLYLNLEYQYDPYGFSYRNLFRKRYEYHYWQISELDSKAYGLKIKMNDGKKIYILSAIINNSDKMIRYMEDKNVS